MVRMPGVSTSSHMIPTLDPDPGSQELVAEDPVHMLCTHLLVLLGSLHSRERRKREAS